MKHRNMLIGIAGPGFGLLAATFSPAQIIEGHPSAGGRAFAASEIATAGAIGEQIRNQTAEPLFIANETDAARFAGAETLMASVEPALGIDRLGDVNGTSGYSADLRPSKGR